MKENNIDNFLRENKPQVKDDPTFILETKNRMNLLEGIKDEVDHNRKTGLLAIIAALTIGLAIGITATVCILLAPKIQIQSPDAILASVEEVLQAWKYLIFALTAACALALSILLRNQSSTSRQ